MASLEYFQMGPADLTRTYNEGMETAVGKLVDLGELTPESAERFLKTYTFVAVKDTSLISRVRRWMFKDKKDEGNYCFPLVKVADER